MSAKQAKRQRQKMLAQGLTPHVDRKREEREFQYSQARTRELAAERFREEHPEEHAEQLRQSRLRGRRAAQGLIGIMGALHGIR